MADKIRTFVGYAGFVEGKPLLEPIHDSYCTGNAPVLQYMIFKSKKEAALRFQDYRRVEIHTVPESNKAARNG